MAVFKKEILLKKIKSKEVKGLTIIGVPEDDLQIAYFHDRLDLLFQEKVSCKHKDIEVYFPKLDEKHYKNICSISVKSCIDESDFITMYSLFKEVYEYYQVYMDRVTINKVLGISEEELTFEDIINFIEINQSQIARMLGKSRQLITDIKSKKAKLSIDNLSILIERYPLLPWIEYIEGYKKFNNKQEDNK